MHRGSKPMPTSTTSLSLPTKITSGTVGVVTFFERELTARGIHLDPGKTVALTPKGHVPTPKDMSLWVAVGVSIADGGGMKVVGVPVGTGEVCDRERHMDCARRGGGKSRAGAAANAG